MSADNWTKCPRCLRRHRKEVDNAFAKAAKSYGLVKRETYEGLKKEALRLDSQAPKNTFREDYEISGVEDGAVELAYSGVCDVCSLSVRFNHEEPIGGIDD